MKRIIALWMAGALLALLMGCNQQEADATDTSSAPPATTTAREEVDLLLPAEDVLSYTKEGNAVTVNVTLAEAAGEEVSLILLTDPAYRLNWWDNADACLSDLGQLSLDETGSGIATLQMKEGASSFCIILPTPVGTYLLEVK